MFGRLSKHSLTAFLETRTAQLQAMRNELTPVCTYAASIQPQRVDNTFDELISADMTLWKLEETLIRTKLRVENGLESVVSAAWSSRRVDSELRKIRAAISRIRQEPFWRQSQIDSAEVHSK